MGNLNIDSARRWGEIAFARSTSMRYGSASFIYLCTAERRTRSRVPDTFIHCPSICTASVTHYHSVAMQCLRYARKLRLLAQVSQFLLMSIVHHQTTGPLPDALRDSASNRSNPRTQRMLLTQRHPFHCIHQRSKVICL